MQVQTQLTGSFLLARIDMLDEDLGRAAGPSGRWPTSACGAACCWSARPRRGHLVLAAPTERAAECRPS